MKEKLIKIILEHTDEDLRVIDLAGLVEAIEALYAEYEGHWMYPTDWAELDPDKWGELTTGWISAGPIVGKKIEGIQIIDEKEEEDGD